MSILIIIIVTTFKVSHRSKEKSNKQKTVCTRSSCISNRISDPVSFSLGVCGLELGGWGLEVTPRHLPRPRRATAQVAPGRAPDSVFGFWVWGCGVWCLVFGVWGLGFGVLGLGFGSWGFEVLRFRGWGWGRGVSGLGSGRMALPSSWYLGFGMCGVACSVGVLISGSGVWVLEGSY